MLRYVSERKVALRELEGWKKIDGSKKSGLVLMEKPEPVEPQPVTVAEPVEEITEEEKPPRRTRRKKTEDA